MVRREENLSFAALQRRLIEDVRRRLHNGEFTERGLARRLGVSQPHVHNVLKGHRILTPEIGDAVLAGLGVDLLALLTDGELDIALEGRRTGECACRQVGLASGVLSPCHAFPDLLDVREWARVPSHCIGNARRPVLVELGPDPELPWAASHALLEIDERRRADPSPGDYCALRYGGTGFCRRVSVAPGRILIRGQRSFEQAGIPDEIDLAERYLPETVRGIVLWTGRDPRFPGSRI